MKALLSNKYFIWICVAVAIAAVIYFVAYGDARGKFKKPAAVALPNGGAGIPVDSNGNSWDPTISVISIHDAMFGSGWWNTVGTDETKIFNTLSPLTDDQVAAVYNAYNAKYYPAGDFNLIDDFNSELSGSDLTNALAYFKNVNI